MSHKDNVSDRPYRIQNERIRTLSRSFRIFYGPSNTLFYSAKTSGEHQKQVVHLDSAPKKQKHTEQQQKSTKNLCN